MAWRRLTLRSRLTAAFALVFGAMLLAYALAGMARQGRPAWRVTPLRLGLAVVIWAALFWLHPYVIGVSPAP